jgi:hypothetical protein
MADDGCTRSPYFVRRKIRFAAPVVAAVCRLWCGGVLIAEGIKDVSFIRPSNA